MLTTNPILEGIPKVALPPQYTTGEATSSHPTIIKEEEEKEEEVVKVSDSENEFEVFDQPLSLKASIGDLIHPFPAQSSHHRGVTSIPDDMRIQRKSPPTLPIQLKPADLKRKREQKGKEVVEGGKTHPSQEGEA